LPRSFVRLVFAARADPLVNYVLGLRSKFRAHWCEERVELSEPLVGTIRLFQANEDLSAVRRELH
jgi:hypothetical protein